MAVFAPVDSMEVRYELLLTKLIVQELVVKELVAPMSLAEPEQELAEMEPLQLKQEKVLWSVQKLLYSLAVAMLRLRLHFPLEQFQRKSETMEYFRSVYVAPHYLVHCFQSQEFLLASLQVVQAVQALPCLRSPSQRLFDQT